MAKTVVLIDDDPDDLDFIRDSIKVVDPTLMCMSFTDPEEAVRFLNSEPIMLPDYIFIDINMPKKSGVECLEDLRKNKELSVVPIIICSTSLPQKVSQNLLQAGANFTFQKPNSTRDYIDVLRHIFKTPISPLIFFCCF